VTGTKDILEHSENILTLEDLNAICDQMLKFIENSGKRRDEARKAIADTDDDNEGGNFEDLEEDEMDLDFQETLEDDFILTISDLFGKIFKIYNQYAIMFVEKTFNVIICRAMWKESTLADKKLAVMIIDEIFEHVGMQQMPKIMVESILDIVITASCDKNSNLRQASN